MVTSNGERGSDSLHLETELYRALSERQLVACYQPIYNLRTRRLDSFEGAVTLPGPSRTRVLVALDDLDRSCRAAVAAGRGTDGDLIASSHPRRRSR